MGEAAYELLALGLRYWFLLLIALTLLRAAWLMRGDWREYRRLMRQLPDAGLIGELVDLRNGKAQPLPREGLIGSGRACDIRIAGLRRREMEFIFRPGLGVRLIPLHRRADALLDAEALSRADAYALHGTVLELRGNPLRFRLFAGLDLPERAEGLVVDWDRKAEDSLPDLAPGAALDLPEPLPPGDAPGPLPGFQTGQGYAPPPRQPSLWQQAAPGPVMDAPQQEIDPQPLPLYPEEPEIPLYPAGTEPALYPEEGEPLYPDWPEGGEHHV